ncbi:unnamed protein product [Protopolystoma xenopodis]|uniref:EF-hand domain-containing protein n=1 Tax=Protopolystoma xenopodis TaxID=117903 RepID=A0A448WUW9_9PLAT|nr:unnamed protein product [Protopolystoma xenopodis]
MSLYERALELYTLCDVEGRGFLERADLRRLQPYLPLTADQLDDVFDRLDNNADGRLTLSEFTNGFGKSPSGASQRPGLKGHGREADSRGRSSFSVVRLHSSSGQSG